MMNGSKSSSSRVLAPKKGDRIRFLKTDDIRRYLERKDFKSRSRRWSVCSNESDSSVQSDTSLRSLPQYSSYRALSSQGSLTTMSNITTPTSTPVTSKLKQPSAGLGKALSKDSSSSASDTHKSVTPPNSLSRENSFTRIGGKSSGIPTPTMSRENSFTKSGIGRLKRESSLPSIKRETSKTSLKEPKSGPLSSKQELSSSEILKREKAPAKKEPAPVRPRKSYSSTSSLNATQISGEPVAGFMIGDRVEISGSQKKGVIQFIGETKFAKGSWAGIVLDEPVGKNDGSVGGVRYFQCAPNCGVFVKVDKLVKSSNIVSPGSNIGLLKLQQGVTPGKETSPNLLTESKELSDYDFIVGDRVSIGENRQGTLRYIGSAGFAKGIWCGVELDEPIGKNDGAVAGTRYFECKPKYGLFSPVHKVKKLTVSDTVKATETETVSDVIVEPSILPSNVQETEAMPQPQAIQHDNEQAEVEKQQSSTHVAADDDARANQQSILKLHDIISKLEKEKSEVEVLLDEEKRKNEDLQFQLEEQLLLSSEPSKDDTAVSADLERLQSLLQEKEVEVKLVEEKLKQCQSVESLLKEEVTKLGKVLSEYQRQETSINSSAEVANQKALQLEDALALKEKELEEMSFLSKEESFNKEEDIRKLKEDIESQNKFLATLETDKKKIQDELSEVKQKSENQKEQISELQSSLEKKGLEASGFLVELNNLKVEHSGCSTKVKSLESRIDGLQKEKETLEVEMAANLQLSGDNSQQLEYLNNNLMQKNRELTDLNGKFADLIAERDQLSSKLHEYEDIVTKERTELLDVRGKLSMYQETLNSKERDLQKAGEKIIALEESSTQNKQAIQDGEKRLNAIKEDNDCIRRERDSLNSAVKDSEEKYSLLNGKYLDLSGKLEAALHEAEKYKIELSRLEQNTKENSNISSQLQKDLATVKAELLSAQEKLGISEQANAATDVKYASACNERDRLNTELETRATENEHLQNELATLRDERDRERGNREAVENDRLSLQNKVEQTLSQLQIKEGELANTKYQLQNLEIKLREKENMIQKELSAREKTSPSPENSNKDDEINFLNSVIVDLQKKNKELEAKITLLETGEIPDLQNESLDLSESGLRRELRPRLFCDICDVFDSHDTEDCPLQSNESENGVKHHGVRGEERPYCIVCEVFGHDAADCDDDMMF